MTHTHTQLRELLAAGTPGPWEVEWSDGKRYCYDVFKPDPNGCPITFNLASFDAALITAAVNALPGLLDELETARMLLVVAAEVCEHFSDDSEDIAGKLSTSIHVYLKGES